MRGQRGVAGAAAAAAFRWSAGPGERRRLGTAQCLGLVGFPLTEQHLKKKATLM